MAEEFWVLRDPNGLLYGKKGALNPSIDLLFSTKRAARAGFSWWKGDVNGSLAAVDRTGWQIVKVNVTSAIDEGSVLPL